MCDYEYFTIVMGSENRGEVTKVLHRYTILLSSS
jgi:hypothetical protein